MHPRAIEFAERATADHGLDVDPPEFPEGTKTAAAAAEAVGCETAQIASSIVIELTGGSRDGALVVAITSGANRVDLAAVAEYYDATGAEMGDAGRIREEVGWSIGGVPPVCHETALPTVMDPTLTTFETVWAAAGTPSAVFPVDPETLQEAADASVVDLTG